MKKINIVGATIAMAFAMNTVSAQAVHDRAIIPVAVTLNEVLRMTITNGGNIEFVFNSIDDYELGMGAVGVVATAGGTGVGSTPAAAAPMYQTDFTIASSSRWALSYGAEETSFLGTDNVANTLSLDNVGLTLTETGAHILANAATDELASAPFGNVATPATGVEALRVFPVVLLTDNGHATNANSGDAADNNFHLFWQCGTAAAQGTAATPMNTVVLLNQAASPVADRYVANVIFELASL